MTHVPLRLLTLTFALSIGILLSTSLNNAGTSAATDATAPPRIGPGVEEAAGSEASVRVIVSLRQPPALRTHRLNKTSLRSQIAAEQDQLAGLPASDFQVTHRYGAIPAVAGIVSPEGLKALEARSDVAEVALDGTGDASLEESVPLIHADTVQAAGVTGAGVIVAVLDTGIDTDHADLADSIAYERCFLSGPGSPCPAAPHPAEDDQGHGTNVAGIITSNGTVSSVGVAPGAKIAAYKILNASGNGLFSDWLSALDDIIDNHPEVSVINMSLQSTLPCPNTAFTTAITTLRQQGVATFIAAGNHGNKSMFTIPSCVTEGISVGAVYDSNVGSVNGWKTDCSDPQTTTDMVTCWSDSSTDLDLLAPGAYVTSTGRFGGLSTFLGTSQASPHAAGVAALLDQAVPGLSVDDVEARMKATGTPITDDLHDGEPATKRQTPRIDARVALLTDLSADYDGDGCTNGQEFGSDPNAGGKRNPLSPWDYMNPTGDGQNRVDDVLATLHQYFVDQGNPNYTQATDRTFLGPYAWSLGPPNGLQRIDDVLASVSQYFDDCAH